MQRWLTRPVFALRVEPGPREAYEEAAGVATASSPAGGGGNVAPSQRPRCTRRPSPATSRSRRRPHAAPRVDRRSVSRQIAALDFPAIERARLSNGIQVVYARRNAVPVTRIAVEFNAGIAADPAGPARHPGADADLLDEGTDRPQLGPDRRGAGAAGREHHHRRQRSTGRPSR